MDTKKPWQKSGDQVVKDKILALGGGGRGGGGPPSPEELMCYICTYRFANHNRYLIGCRVCYPT